MASPFDADEQARNNGPVAGHSSPGFDGSEEERSGSLLPAAPRPAIGRRAEIGAGLPAEARIELLRRELGETRAEALPAVRRSELQRRLAVALQSAGHWREAVALLEETALLARRNALPAQVAAVDIEFGKIAMVHGEVERALELAARAAEEGRRLEDSLVVGFAENLRGWALHTLGRLEESAACFHEAMRAFNEAGDVQNLSLAYNNLGLVHKARCEWTRAQECFQVAVNLQGIDGDQTERRKALHNLAVVRFKLGQWSEATRAFEEALAIGRELGQPLSILRSLLGLAQVHLERGLVIQARDLLDQSLELCAQESYPREAALTQRSLGQLHLLSGDLDRARRCFETAWKKAVELAPEGDLACELLLLRAEVALRANHPREAVSLAERSRQMALKAGDSYEAARAYRVLAACARATGDADRAEDLLNEGIRSFREIETPYPLALSLLDLGRLAIDRLTLRSDVDRVLQQLEEALRLFRALGIERGRGETLLALARAHVRTGAYDRASAFLSEATVVFRGLELPEAVALVTEVQQEIEGRFVQESIGHLNEFRATSRIQEILDARVDTATRIGQILDVIAGALEADGAMLVSSTHAAGAEPVAFRRLNPAVARSLSPRLVRLEEALEGRPQIILNLEACADLELSELGRRNSAMTMILVPLKWKDGKKAVLYLDRTRSGRASSFRQSHLNLCVVLSSYLTDLLAENDRDLRVTANLRLKKQMEERIALADVVTQNAEMLKILRLVEKINHSNLTVLLQGETGTGKTLIARVVHLSSPRAQGPFVTVDCAALPENLLESELFGYLRGSFTGATADKKGLFEEADGGTIFLDEIGRAGLTVQRRLLHLLDKGEVRPVGSNQYRKLDVRVICATSSRDLREDVARGDFIKDLYFRLNDISIVVPALRDRVEDIPLLAECFLESFLANLNQGARAGAERRVPGISRPVMNRLLRYHWPGNVRELEKVIRRAAILCDDDDMIGLDHLPDELMHTPAVPVGAADSGRASRPAPGRGGAHGELVDANGPGERSATDAASLHTTVEEMERRMVLTALEECRWNKSRAAIKLGLSRKGLKNKITRYGLDRPAPPATPPRPR